MKLFQLIIVVCIHSVLNAGNGNEGDEKPACVAALAMGPELELLQGTWVGIDVGDPSHQTITITITGSGLRFYRDKDFWFNTTITLTSDKDPRHLHATVNESANDDAKGQVVGAIYKIEDHTMTLASYANGNEDPPTTFESYPSYYVLKRVPKKQKNAETDSEEKDFPPYPLNPLGELEINRIEP